MPARVWVELRHTALSVDECLRHVVDPAAGGVAVFLGMVRDEDEGQPVAELQYEAHPGALGELERVVARVADEVPLTAVAAAHRLGRLAVGDLAVVVAASAPHRAEAFAGCRRLIDNLKAEVPIWKQQTFTSGQVSWVGCPTG